MKAVAVQRLFEATPNQDGTPARSALDYDESPEQAREHLRLALPMLGKFKLAPNPINYAVCYEYVLGRTPALCEAVEHELPGAVGCPDSVAKQLYERFIWDDDKRALAGWRNDLRRIVVETLMGLGAAQRDAGDSKDVMETCSQRLTGVLSSDQVRAVIADVVAEVESMVSNGQALEDMLQEAKKEVEVLRAELQHTKRQAVKDPLTGLLNRRAFDDALVKAVEAVGVERDGLCLLIADIDYFKRVNDNWGHLTGDKVLQAVASLLKDNVKGRDTTARYGGEEFAIILPETSLAAAKTLADSIRARVETSRVTRRDTGESIGCMTISIGLAVYNPGDAIPDFVARADAALYQAKANGRNRVEVASS